MPRHLGAWGSLRLWLCVFCVHLVPGADSCTRFHPGPGFSPPLFTDRSPSLGPLPISAPHGSTAKALKSILRRVCGA